MAQTQRFILVISMIAVAVGCSDKKVAYYRVPKEPDAPESMTSPQAIAATPTANSPLKYRAPAGWTEETAVAPRAATFKLSGDSGASAEVSVIAFPGSVGGDLANLNRWRGQLGLSEISQSEIPKALSSFSAPAGEFKIANLAGQTNGKPTRILGAILSLPDRSWFFKLMGDDALVNAQADSFRQFLSSVSFETPSEVQVTQMPGKVADTNGLPRSASPNLLLAPTSEANSSGLGWSAPSTWKVKDPGQMRFASFAVPLSGGEGDLSVTVFPGEAGGLLENINRWRGQIKLPPLKLADVPSNITSLQNGGLQTTVVDFAGSGSRVLGAIVPYGGQTWFFKLTGQDSAVAGAKDEFLGFLRTLHPMRPQP